jgi:hypothetical protein
MRAKKSPSPRTERRPADDCGAAFLPDLVRDVAARGAHGDWAHKRFDEEADALAEEFLASAISAGDAFEDARDEMMVEELGGPFVDDEDLDWSRLQVHANATPWAA